VVDADLKARDTSQITIHLPRVPHMELLEIGQQTEFGRKRRELVAADLKHNVTVGQITIQSVQQSHIEPLERLQVRDFARQRAKVVAGEVECLQVLHAEQLGRHLRQTHAIKLTTMCES
jgi:hypothetical protein